MTLIHETPYDFPNSGYQEDGTPTGGHRKRTGRIILRIFACRAWISSGLYMNKWRFCSRNEKRCGTILERTDSKSELQCTVRRGRCRNIFRWKTEIHLSKIQLEGTGKCWKSLWKTVRQRTSLYSHKPHIGTDL